ncbi:hypothetical protein [Zhihengliuella halotolerans]|uniref:hypothetical protein n=1 Tax=Zhihengliuella halotolerans TaxID=370736 RepID=UPI0011AEFA6A|nr:hypothetical protein [Zhihengliuella halotolerans]
MEKGKSHVQTRGFNGINEDHAPLWDTVSHAADLLLEVESMLDDFEAAGIDIAHYRDTLPAWWRALILPRVDWWAVSQQSQRLMNPAELNMLKALSGLIDNTAHRFKATAPASAFAGLSELLRQAEEYAADDRGLEERTRVRIAGLISKVRLFIEDGEDYSPEQLEFVIDQLTGVLTRAAVSAGQPATRSAYLKLAGQLMMGWAINASWDAGQDVLEYVGEMKQLTE